MIDRFRFGAFSALFVLIAIGSFSPVQASEPERTGAALYQNLCSKCHGDNGEGVADQYDEPLYGDRSIQSLARLIERTMPEEDPDLCVGEDAAQVARYIYDAFYSPEARARINPPTIRPARLTVSQYLNTAADLVGSFRPKRFIDEERGLRVHYYDARNFKEEKKVFDRVESKIDFRFGEESPDPETIGSEEFAIRWEGSVIAEETGDYEFCLRTENGARLWVNNRNTPLIDAWVSSGGEVREHKETIHLLGGRAYPIRVHYFKFKDKSASIALLWKPPHKVLDVIPERNLSPVEVPEGLVVTTAFPADDSSVGYERGTAVSKAWDSAATHAAIEVAAHIIEHLDSLSGTKPGDSDRIAGLKRFCERFAERAFRRPLTAEQKEFFVEQQFAEAADPENAVKRVMLLVLKSPRFLYPEIGQANPDQYDIASRLALGLWDSLPDDTLLKAAANGELNTPEQVASQAKRMLRDSRTRTKLRGFFHAWLRLEEAEDLSKDPEAYPAFNEAVAADLRTSLELFLEEVLWSERSDYRELLLADYLFLNPRLADFYGVGWDGPEQFQKIAFAPKERSGVITHPYLLSALAYHKSSSPIHRGVFLTRSMLGRALKPPPMAIQFMDGRFDPDLTMREKVTELTSPKACQGCHSIINPLGFSLEHYDAVGRFRTLDQEKKIDASSEYPTTDGEMIRITGARDVAEHAAANDEAHRGFIQNLFEHIVKQPPAAYAPDTLSRLQRSFAASDFNMQRLVLEIVTTSALHRTVQPNPHEHD